ncbi:SGNH/GDSL hydrolase family protein [Chitinophaga sp. 22321]|uniref:SGNH/GDSL hydrolase family protein n=1 Tax=Chitinophaga hostae TaxID=2831022 RepID=A0ABS5JA01_9BACT|nr:SGNH/GDSL hydrolase family protein [Chitinophaga hostae]MBS0032032.1 SGNH/GDSL hydrolase family protein [Chitinophaga hostae]
MKRKLVSGVAVLLFLMNVCAAQAPRVFKSWVPAEDNTVYALEGQGWKDGLDLYYDRLPQRAEDKVRTAVWNLSGNSAGLSLRFRTDADEIVVKYTVRGVLAMPHMPATGVSGVDMYAKSIDGKWMWCAGKYNFNDTIVYRFSNLNKYDQHVKNTDYTLYLPLYNSVKWLSVEVPEESLFKPLPVRKAAPIVIYGTSIAQGACASRPGMAWTNILERKMERPVINLGFSGNGRLEKEVVDFVTEIDASVYVLDCLPNLIGKEYRGAELKKRITETVKQLQRTHPDVPVLLTAHDGYSNDETSAAAKESYEQVNATLQEVVDSMWKAGVKHISLLTKEEIGQDLESMVDGTHPTDLGMMKYADAYTKKLKSILNETGGNTVTTTPVTQRRDAATYDWETRHQEVLAYNKTHRPKVVFIGNSITHFWGGNPEARVKNGSLSWEKYFEPKRAVNMGFGWDRVENVLWRVQHGELDGISPGYIVLMIGTNNLQLNSDTEIVDGLKYLLQTIRTKQPDAQILLMGILPRRNMEERVARINRLIAAIPGEKIQFLDAGKLFLKPDGKIEEHLFSDGLHPNQEGYEGLGALISQYLKK